jgi:hypothetical protein
VPAPVACPGCWHPPLKVSWQWQLSEPPKIAALLDVSMYDVDGFESSARLVRAMHKRTITAVCYLSAGTWEKWRPDASRFPAKVLGKSNGWPGERWLDNKNDLGQIGKLVAYFDASLNEQCFQYNECGALSGFVDANKPVFQVEYRVPSGRFCPKANKRNFNSLRKRLALGAWRVPCRGA